MTTQVVPEIRQRVVMMFVISESRLLPVPVIVKTVLIRSKTKTSIATKTVLTASVLIILSANWMSSVTIMASAKKENRRQPVAAIVKTAVTVLTMRI